MDKCHPGEAIPGGAWHLMLGVLGLDPNKSGEASDKKSSTSENEMAFGERKATTKVRSNELPEDVRVTDIFEDKLLSQLLKVELDKSNSGLTMLKELQGPDAAGTTYFSK